MTRVAGWRRVIAGCLRTDRDATRSDGFAVLWALVLLAFIVTQLLSAGRSEAQLAGNLRNSAEMEAAADGAIQEATFHLLAAGSQHWATRGAYQLRIGHGVVAIGIEDAADKINPNAATLVLLRSLAGLCGADGSAAARLAQAIIDWRSADAMAGVDPAVPYRAAGLDYAPPGLPFQTLDELGLVIGMTPPLLTCMRPHLSLYQANNPGPRTEDPLVARALALAALEGDAAGAEDAAGSHTVMITAVAANRQGSRFVRRATVRLGEHVRILAWH
jgi:general secretion pathway protein K